MTNQQKVMELILSNPDGLDDDEISELAEISPRQQIYQICNRLEASGKIERVSIEKPGKRKKIHNFPITTEALGSSHFGEKPMWKQRMQALIAATGKSEDELLDEALKHLALRVLEEQRDKWDEQENSNE